MKLLSNEAHLAYGHPLPPLLARFQELLYFLYPFFCSRGSTFPSRPLAKLKNPPKNISSQPPKLKEPLSKYLLFSRPLSHEKSTTLCPQLSKAPLLVGRPPKKSQQKHPPAQSVLSKLKKIPS